MNQTNISQSLVDSEDRRRFSRHRAFAITYLDLGDDNGGILLNLGGGGLSFQAVAKLNPGQDIALRFGLFNDTETITVKGKVIWLGPTRKEAGVCFADLSDVAEQSIARWLAAQEAERVSAERKSPSLGGSESATNEIHLIPPQFSPALTAIRHSDVGSPTQTSPPAGIPGEAHLGEFLLDHALNRAKTSPVFGTYVPTMTPTRLVAYPKEQPKPAASSANAPKESLDAEQPTIRFLRTIPPENGLRQVDHSRVEQSQVVRAGSDPQLLFTSTPVISSASAAPVYKVHPALPIFIALQKNRRLVQVTAGIAACVGIFLILLMMESLGNHPADDGSSAAVASASDISTPAAGASNSEASPNATVGTAKKPEGQQNISQQRTEPSSRSASDVTGSSDSTLALRQIAPQVAQRGTDSSWLVALEEALFGMEDKPKLDPVVAGISVWADQRTGFYYCASSPYFVKPERVSLVKQGEALQSGFQPKLGTYCY